VSADESDEFARVRAALDDAGLPSGDIGRFTSGKYPDVIRPEVFDYRGAVAVLLELMPTLQGPSVKEAVVRSLSTAMQRVSRPRPWSGSSSGHAQTSTRA